MNDIPPDLLTPDLLAAIPLITGSEPKNTLAIMTFAGPEPDRVFCLNLPAQEAEAACRRLATTAIGLVCSVPNADSVLLALYTDRLCPGARRRPFERLQRLVASRLHGSGFHLVDSFYVAANGWGSYCCTDPRCRLATPSPLADLHRRTRQLREEREP